MTTLLRAMDSFKVPDPDGGPARMVLAGSDVTDDDPVVKGREHLFVPAEEFADRNARPIESATAAPGEIRTTRRPAKKKA